MPKTAGDIGAAGNAAGRPRGSPSAEGKQGGAAGDFSSGQAAAGHACTDSLETLLSNRAMTHRPMIAARFDRCMLILASLPLPNSQRLRCAILALQPQKPANAGGRAPHKRLLSVTAPPGHMVRPGDRTFTLSFAITTSKIAVFGTF